MPKMKPKHKKTRRLVGEDGDGEDRISSLPDNLIHHIFSFIDARFAVQSGILSNRWKNVWKTLPHLNFHSEHFSRIDRFLKFVDKFISHRNNGSNVDTVNYRNHGVLNAPKVECMMRYAISHKVKNLYIKSGSGKNKTMFQIYLFQSKFLEKLTIDTAGVELSNIYYQNPWSMPALTELKLSECELPRRISWSFPARCSWSFPALISLDLTGIMFTKHNIVDFSDIVNLKRLSLSNCTMSLDLETFDIYAYQLEHLTISNDTYISDKNDIRCFRTCKFVLSTPKLCCFILQGSYPIIVTSDGLECLDKVFIDCIEPDTGSSLHRVQRKESKQIGQRFIDMFKEFSHAKCLMLSFYTIKVLSRVRDLLQSQVSPFSNLMSLKLQKKCTTATIPSLVESYLLSDLQSATKSSMIDLEYKTVAVNVGSCMPLSALVDQLDRKGIADVNAIGAEEARKFQLGYQFWSLVTAKSNVKDKGVAPQAADKAPVVYQSLEGSEVRTTDPLCCPTKNLSKALRKELVEDTESFVLADMCGTGDEVEHHVEVLADAEQNGVQDEYVEACICKDKFVKSTLDERIKEGWGGQQNAGGEAVLATGKMVVFSESFPDQVNEVCTETGGASERVDGVATSALVVGDRDQMSCSGNVENSNILLGHAEDKDLLALIKRKYPETFYGFTPQSEMIRTIGLNTLCTALKTFSNVSTAEVTAANISEYKSLFTDLERWGFNLDWLVKHLNSVEQLRFSRPLVNELNLIDCNLQVAQREVQKQQSLRAAKMLEIQEAFGQFGTNLVTGRIGDMLFEKY